MTARRLAWLLVIAGLAGAAWIAGAWVDDPPDATCGSVFRTDLWLDRPGCQTVMWFRVALSTGLAAASTSAAVALLVSRRRRRRAAPAARPVPPAG